MCMSCHPVADPTGPHDKLTTRVAMVHTYLNVEARIIGVSCNNLSLNDLALLSSKLHLDVELPIRPSSQFQHMRAKCFGSSMQNNQCSEQHSNAANACLCHEYFLPKASQDSRLVFAFLKLT